MSTMQTGAIQSMGRPMTTMAARPITTTGGSAFRSRAAPAVEYIQEAPMVEYIQQPRAIQQQSVAIKNRDLKAMGTVVSERVITIDELASVDRYAEGETVQVQAQREIVVQQPQVVEYIQQAPMVEYVQEQVVEYIQPQMIQAAPQLS